MAFWTGGPHPTSGLAGYPARDYGAPGGTPVYAWTNLQVRRISGASGYRGGGFGGLNLYLTDSRGREFFATHVENVRVKVGDKLRAGQQIAEVGNYGTPHVHVGYTGGDPVDTLGLRPEYLFTPGGSVAGSRVVDQMSSQEAAKRQSSGISGVGISKYGPTIAGYPIGPGQIPFLAEKAGVYNLPGLGTVQDAFNAPGDALRWVGTNWYRILEVGGGFVLVVIGLVLMGRSLGVTKQRIEVVEKRLPGSLTGRAPDDTPPARKESVRVPKTRVVYTDEPRYRPRRTSTGSVSGQGEIPF